MCMVFDTETRTCTFFVFISSILQYLEKTECVVCGEGEAVVFVLSAGGCHVEMLWARHSSRIISHPNSCPGAKSQRIAET